jgi:ssDNA-binding Zn-finger/Zn-ribbon topoisomerase 1
MPIWTYECVNVHCKECREELILTSKEKKELEFFHPDPCPKCDHTMKRVIGLTAKGIVK